MRAFHRESARGSMVHIGKVGMRTRSGIPTRRTDWPKRDPRPVTNEVALVTCQRGRPTLRNWCWVKARPRAIKDGDCGNFSTMRGKFAVFDLAGTFLALLWVVLPLNFAGLTCNNVGYSCS